jgi:hypothetical protein
MAKKSTKNRKRKSGMKGEAIVTEEKETRVYPARKRVVVRTEPATLSEAIGEPVAVGPAPVRRVVRTRRVA